MKNIELVRELTELQVLTMRWVERNTNLQCKTHRELDRIIMNNKLTCTYKAAIKNLKMNIEKFCNSEYLYNKALEIEQKIKNSDLADLRFGVEPQLRFTEEEQKLDTEMITTKLKLITNMLTIKGLSEMLDITESGIKQACQQERLLNTQKVGKTWLVHYEEAKKYWNKE